MSVQQWLNAMERDAASATEHSWFPTIRNWFRARRILRERRAYRKGFSCAFEMALLDKYPLSYIDELAQPKLDESSTALAFDRGMRDAIRAMAILVRKRNAKSPVLVSATSSHTDPV